MTIGYQIIASKLVPHLEGLAYDALFVLCDAQVEQACPTLLAPVRSLVDDAHWLSIDAGEEGKSIRTIEQVWDFLLAGGATRHSVLLLIGGGSLTDLGGFAGATYMRGIRTLSLSTSLLGMVDASTGGKTGINYAGVKNIIGSFHAPEEVFIDVAFLDTLPIEELYSGYAEVIKTALLESEDFWHTLLRMGDPQAFSHQDWTEVITRCVRYKEHITTVDFKESGLRKVLNLGHTVAHALEAYSHAHATQARKPLLHGEAVIIGMIVELYLTHLIYGGSRQTLSQLMMLCRDLYPKYAYACKTYPELISLMKHDKKNSLSSGISFVGLVQAGVPLLFDVQDEKQVESALDFYREVFGS